jgi:putative ABC transport system permease protein
MKISDMIELGFANLWRTKLRTTLTTLGVVIGIGALTSMISFGTGMERNITEAFKNNDLFNSLTVTARRIDLESIADGDVSSLAGQMAQPVKNLTDSTLHAINEVEGVEIAFPEMTFRAKLKIIDKEREISVAGIPYELKKYQPFSNVTFGSFFDNDSSAVVLVRWEILKQMKIIVEDPDEPVKFNFQEEGQDFIVLPPEYLIGKPIQLTTAVMDYSNLALNPMKLLSGDRPMPFKEETTTLILGGIIKRQSQFANRNIKGDVMVPYKTANKIPRLGFTNIWDVLGGGSDNEGYNAIYVRLEDPSLMNPVVKRLKDEMGLNVFALTDQLKEVRRAFLILDGILGAIGTIALVVAGLGIVNTMIMSILERTREIGVMKAIGGSESQIKWIFFVEAGTIGFIGAIFGLILGWIVTRVANQIANSQFLPAGEPQVDFFYFPIWLILGSIAFSIILSLLAGLYPAIRAARIDPVRALRHD